MRQSRTKFVGTDEFCVKRGPSACKLLPSTTSGPPPPLQCWLLEEEILVNSSITFSSAFKIAMGGGGGGSQLEIYSKRRSVSRVLSSIVIGLKNEELLVHSERFVDSWIEETFILVAFVMSSTTESLNFEAF